MILPAIIGRNLLPDLIAQGRTADTYVMLVMKLLPVGMIGIIMAAMFSATMAVVSADFNAIASVLTKDVYQRLLRPTASEGDLVRTGRWTTLGLGAVTTLLSLWIALSQQQSLFNTMVTVLGLFMAPTFLPLLAGLTVRRLNWQGALAGFLGGLSTGLVMLAVKTWWLPGHPEINTYTFEGISILANIGVTVVGLWAGTILAGSSVADRDQTGQFFAALDHPIQPDEVPAGGTNPAAPVLGLSTLAVGLLLAVAGALSGSRTAQMIDFSTAAVLVAIGVLFRRKK
jgi:Na+/proline symporter